MYFFSKQSCTDIFLFRGDVTSSNSNESAIFRRWKSNLKWRMFHRLNDKGDNSLTEIPGFPEKRDTLKKTKTKTEIYKSTFCTSFSQFNWQQITKQYNSHLYYYVTSVPDLPLCLGVIKHRALQVLRWIFAYVEQF